MKIAHFVAVLKKEDGVGLVLHDLAEQSLASGDEVIIVTGHVDDDLVVPVPVIVIPSIPFPLYKEYKIPMPGMKGFEKELQAFNPDVLHIHSPETSAWAAIQYAKTYHIPIVATYHTDFSRYLSYFYVGWLRPLLWRYLKKLYNNMASVTSPSYAIGEELASRGIQNISTIPWGVDTARFNPTHRSLAWRSEINGDSAPIVLYVGRLVWYKDLSILAETYALLKKSNRQFSMVVVGDGPARQELERRMPGATFLGHQEGAALSTTYASSDIFLFPSSTEVFGRVTTEAVASNLIAVLADTPTYKAMHEKYELGVLAKTKNAQSFYAAVSEILDTPTLQETLRQKNTVTIQHFSWPEVSKEYREIYTRVLQK